MPMRRATSRRGAPHVDVLPLVTSLRKALDDGGPPTPAGELVSQCGSGDAGAGDHGVTSHGAAVFPSAGQAKHLPVFLKGLSDNGSAWAVNSRLVWVPGRGSIHP